MHSSDKQISTTNGYVWIRTGHRLTPIPNFNRPLRNYLAELLELFPPERAKLLRDQLKFLQTKQITSATPLPKTLSSILREEIVAYFQGTTSQNRIRLANLKGYHNEPIVLFLLEQAKVEPGLTAWYQKLAQSIRTLPHSVTSIEEIDHLLRKTAGSGEQSGLDSYPQEVLRTLNRFLNPIEEAPALIKRSKGPNERLARYLEREADAYSSPADKYRAAALRNSAQIIRKIPEPITQLRQVEGKKGIGEGSLRRIKAFLTNPELQKADEEEQAQEIIEYFKTHRGIGDVKAKQLYENGYRTEQDLIEDRLGLLNRATRLSQPYEAEIAQRIPREVISQIDQQIFQFILKGIEYVIGGSYRRLRPSSGDIDLLIKKSPRLNLEWIVGLISSYVLVDLTPNGTVSRQLIVRFPEIDNVAHRMDIRLFTPENWPYELMRLTGSKQFNKLMSQRALDLGYTLTEHYLEYLRFPEIHVNVEDEEGIFEALGVRYYPPEERNDDLTSLELIPDWEPDEPLFVMTSEGMVPFREGTVEAIPFTHMDSNSGAKFNYQRIENDRNRRTVSGRR